MIGAEVTRWTKSKPRLVPDRAQRIRDGLGSILAIESELGTSVGAASVWAWRVASAITASAAAWMLVTGHTAGGVLTALAALSILGVGQMRLSHATTLLDIEYNRRFSGLDCDVLSEASSSEQVKPATARRIAQHLEAMNRRRTRMVI